MNNSIKVSGQLEVLEYDQCCQTATAQQLACDIVNLTHMASASQLAALLYGMDLLNTDASEGYTVTYWAERFEEQMNEKGYTDIGGLRCRPCEGGFAATL